MHSMPLYTAMFLSQLGLEINCRGCVDNAEAMGRQVLRYNCTVDVICVAVQLVQVKSVHTVIGVLASCCA